MQCCLTPHSQRQRSPFRNELCTPRCHRVSAHLFVILKHGYLLMQTHSTPNVLICNMMLRISPSRGTTAGTYSNAMVSTRVVQPQELGTTQDKGKDKRDQITCECETGVKRAFDPFAQSSYHHVLQQGKNFCCLVISKVCIDL